MIIKITVDHLKSISGVNSKLLPELVKWMNELCPKYEIDTVQEYAHFLAQACHETDHFNTLKEYASGQAYEGRKDLGNTEKGDGVRFKGRGIFQTTGRANYLALGLKKGKRDFFILNPELLETPQYAVWSACEFWKDRNFNDISNMENNTTLTKKMRGKIYKVSPVEYISMTINGGTNGLKERVKYFNKALQIIK